MANLRGGLADTGRMRWVAVFTFKMSEHVQALLTWRITHGLPSARTGLATMLARAAAAWRLGRVS